MFLRLFISLALPLLLAGQLKAQDSPTLGLALSGGGAKGLAHIGVLREFEKAGIYPDVVSGTSMGSIVGGLYSIGYDPTELERTASAIDWNSYFSDSYESRFIPIEERRRSALYQISFFIENGSLKLPKGLLQGRKIQTLLAGLTSPSAGMDRFDDFPLPFRAVATDIVTGEAYTFSEGYLHQAIRSSMAIPSVFSPVKTPDGHLLVDGLVVRNLPVQEALDMGAKVTIAVDVGTPLYKEEELSSLIRIIEQTASFGSASFNDVQRGLADIVLDPELTPFTTLDYGATDSIIERGAASARRALPRILKQLDSLGIDLPREAPNRPRIQIDSFYITKITHRSASSSATRIMEKLVQLQAPGLLTREDLEREIGELYGSGFFNLVDFHFEPDTNGLELVFSAIPAPAWRMRLSAAYDSDYNVGLLVNLTGRNVIGEGSVLSFDARVSEFPRATMEYLLYNQTRPSIGIRALASANFYPGRVYENRDLVGEFNGHHYSVRLSAFSGQGGGRYVEGGLISETFTRNPRVFSIGNNESSLQRQIVFAELIRETYDRSIYPHSGSRTAVYAHTAVGGQYRNAENEDFDIGSNVMLIGRHKTILPLGKSTALLLGASGGFVNHEQFTLLNALYLGRALPQEPQYFNVLGQRFMELPVSGFFSARTGLRFEVGVDNFIGLHYQFGQYALTEGLLVRGSRPYLNPDRVVTRFQGFALELGSSTILGPVKFFTEYNPDLGRLNYNIHFGYLF